MNELLIMVLSCFVVYHAVGRMAKFPSLVNSPWRCKVLGMSMFFEFAGAASSFGCAYLGAEYYVPLCMLLISMATAPFAERRQNKERLIA